MQTSTPIRLHHFASVVTVLTCLASAYGTASSPAPAFAASHVSALKSQAAPQIPLALSGLVFRDANFNGARDVGESGIAGVIVTAYDSTGTASPIVTTLADGTYTLTPAGAGPYRVEFSGWPSFLRPGPRGTDSGTTVQFVSTGSVTNINLGLANPADFGGASPRLATTVYAAGDATNSMAALVSWPYASDTDTKAGLVTHTTASDIGSTFGLAYKPSTRDFFTSAFVKRGVGLGTAGAGAIYKVSAAGTVSVLVDLGAAAGGFTRTRDFTPGPPDFDADAMALVGKAGFGDLDISEDETTLWTINLANRSLYKIDIATAEAGVGAAGTTLIGPPPNPGCVNDTSGGRPFGLKVKDGVIYVGGVCTGQNGPALGSTDDIQAYVYTYTESAGWGTAPVLQFKLNYPTTCADVYASYTPNKSCNRPGVLGSDAAWYSWFDELPKRTAVFTTEYSFNSETSDGFVVSPQPLLTGIEFSGDDMIVALRDRFADQIGWDDPGPFGASPFGASNMSAVPMGDILRASPNRPTTTSSSTSSSMSLSTSPSTVISWTLEKNTTGSTFGPTAGAGTGAGPCVDTPITPTVADCGEFFVDNFNPTPSTGHDETTIGSVAQIPGYPEVAVTVYDPFALQTAGVLQLSNTTGQRVRGYEVVAGGSLIQAGSAVNKANGLGDLEALLDPAPLEIGNLVWRDTNRNGMQDPNENGIAGVTVRLYRPGVGADCVAGNADDAVAIATALTSATGQYYFKTGTGPDALPADETGLVDGSVCPLLPTATYSIRLDEAADYAAAGPLDLLFLTERDDAVASPSGSDSNDSDSSYAGPVAVITYTVPVTGIGASDHTLDFGFTLQVTTPVTPPTTTAVSLGNQVWFDTDNDSVVDANETGVANTILQLYFDANANNTPDPIEQTPIATQTTTAQGFYLFTQTVTGTALAAGNYWVCVMAPNFSIGGALNGYYSSGTTLGSTGVLTETDPGNADDDVDNNDSGRRNGSGVCVSTLASVTGNEPMNEVPGNSPNTLPGTTPGLTDVVTNTASNLTLDFGFYQVGLGNLVWIDENNSGRLDSAEKGLDAIPVRLFPETGTSEIPVGRDGCLGTADDGPGGTLTSNLNGQGTGHYSLCGLPQGTYRVCIVQPVGYGSSIGGAGNPYEPAPDPDGEGSTTPNTDSDDNGSSAPLGICTDGITSKAVTLQPGSVPNVSNAVDFATGKTVNPTVDFGLIVLNPNAVSLTSFEAVRESGAEGIQVRWQTGAELNTFGFALYRSEGQDRDQAVLVTRELVAALGAGNAYQFRDAGADATRTYHYWLKEYEQVSDGAGYRENWYGPAMYAPGAGLPVAAVALVASELGGGVPVMAAPAMAAPAMAAPASSNAPNTSDASASTLAQPANPAQSAQTVQVSQASAAEPAPLVASAAAAPESPAAKAPDAVSAVSPVQGDVSEVARDEADIASVVPQTSVPQAIAPTPAPTNDALASVASAAVVQAAVRAPAVPSATESQPPAFISPAGAMLMMAAAVMVGLSLLMSLAVGLLRRRL